MNSNNYLELLRSGYKKKKGRPKASNISRKTEIYYTRALLDISKQCKVEGEEILAVIKDSGRFIGDAYVGDAPSFLNRIAGIVKNGIVGRISSLADVLASKVAKDQKEAVDDRLAKQLKFMTGIDTREIIRYGNASKVLEDAVAVNVTYIKSLPTEYHASLEKIIMTGLQQGKGTVWLGEEIQKLGKKTDNRAKLIARDQIISISQQFNKESQRELGIGEYVWITKEDRRVRGNPNCIYPQYRHVINSHYARHDKVMSWDERPDDGFPGEPIMCRCDAFPYLG